MYSRINVIYMLECLKKLADMIEHVCLKVEDTRAKFCFMCPSKDRVTVHKTIDPVSTAFSGIYSLIKTFTRS